MHTNPAHPEVVYLMSSICHPKTINNGMDGKDIKLWHINLKGITYPEGELVIEGYWDVGQEAILVTKALGYRNLHLFGYDYAFETDTGETHAGFHNGTPKKYVFAQIGERLYKTSDDLARGVLAFTALMKDHPDLTLTVYSDGLLGAYLKYHYGEMNEHPEITTN